PSAPLFPYTTLFRSIDPYYGSILLDQPILASDKVRYEGEPVVAIAATTKEAAFEAAELVDVEYKELPVLDTMEKALSETAPKVQDRKSTRLNSSHVS